MSREDKTAGRQIPTLSSYFLWTEAFRQCKQNLCQQGCTTTRHGELLRAVYGTRSIKTWLTLDSVNLRILTVRWSRKQFYCCNANRPF